MKVRVTLRDGNWFDMEIGTDFDFIRFAQSIRSAGCILSDRMYVAHDMITSMFIHQEGQPPVMQPKDTLQ